MSMEWRTLPEFTLKYIENLQCLIHLNDFVDQSSLRPFSHLFETATRKFTRGTVGPSHLQILRQFLTQNSAWQSSIPAQNHCYLIHLDRALPSSLWEIPLLVLNQKLWAPLVSALLVVDVTFYANLLLARNI